MITQDRLKELLSYEPDTGLFRWQKSMPPRGRIGAIAGHDNGNGYTRIRINQRQYHAHRLAFLWMTGAIPGYVDHINGVKSDNRWNNLRACTQAQNCANVQGRRGVRFRHGKWQARFSNLVIGTFSTEREALAARKAVEIRAAGLDPNTTI